jgi:hypothetical protein
VMLSSPTDVAKLGVGAQHVGGVITDPILRSAESAALAAQQVAREANLLAWNDVFLIISVLASLLFLWGVVIELNMRRRGEISPIVRFGQAMAAKLAAGVAEQSGGVPQ